MNDILEKQIGRQADVMWVGLSFKGRENGGLTPPLDSSTNSGLLVEEMENECPGIKFYKTNLVKFAPVDSGGKLRYPTKEECLADFPKLLNEIEEVNPEVIFLLGNYVSDFVFKKVDVERLEVSNDRKVFEWRRKIFASIYHPSYIMVYKRGEKDLYIQSVKDLISRFL